MNKRSIFNNIKHVYGIISRGAMMALRCPSEVHLIAVTKTVDTHDIKKAVESGLRVFGENRVQEAKKKILSEEISSMPEKLQ